MTTIRTNPDLDSFMGHAEPPPVKRPASDPFADYKIGTQDVNRHPSSDPRREPPPLPSRLYFSRTPCRIHWE